jgi:hypothetical protein
VREVVVMAEAIEDILQARDFYERIERGVGAYCVQCLWQDIHRLKVTHGVHEVHFGFFRALSEVFPVGIYYRRLMSARKFLPCWTCVALRTGYTGN